MRGSEGDLDMYFTKRAGEMHVCTALRFCKQPGIIFFG